MPFDRVLDRANDNQPTAVQLKTDALCGRAYASWMAKETVLTDAELVVLTAIDGSLARSRMPAKIKARLTELRLVERREWPNGPLWRTAAGNQCVRNGKRSPATSPR